MSEMKYFFAVSATYKIKSRLAGIIPYLYILSLQQKIRCISQDKEKYKKALKPCPHPKADVLDPFIGELRLGGDTTVVLNEES